MIGLKLMKKNLMANRLRFHCSNAILLFITLLLAPLPRPCAGAPLNVFKTIQADAVGRQLQSTFVWTGLPNTNPVVAVGFRGINSWARGSCKSCSERLKTGKPAELLPSGLLGPVRVMGEE
ncbi:MAG: hypothetical protein WCH57_12715 [Verrucomicrobiota bacterium]